MSAGWSASRAVLGQIARAAEICCPDTPPDAAAPNLLLRGHAIRVNEGPSPAAPVLRRAVGLLLAGETADIGVVPFIAAIAAAADLWDDTALELLTTRWVRLARESGELGTLRVALAFRSIFGDVLAGRLAAARAAADERRTLAEATRGSRAAPDGDDLLLPLVFAGSETQAREAAAAVAEAGRARRAFGAVVFAAYGLGVLELSLGNYAAATGWLEQVCDDDGPLTANALPDLVEAAVRAGRRDIAEFALRRLGERARASGTPLALGLLARSDALLADNDRAGDCYEGAVEQLRGSRSTPQLARAHLLYGEWLRRQRRRRDAREQLRAAHDMFDAMGHRLFAERARVELRATGEHAQHRDVGAPEQLTPREAQIADLVSRGDSNQQIAAQLFLSPSTVEYHLRKVFRKVGVTSRTQLARRIMDEDGPR